MNLLPILIIICIGLSFIALQDALQDEMGIINVEKQILNIGMQNYDFINIHCIGVELKHGP